MRKFLLAIVLIATTPVMALTCDICASPAAGASIGTLPQSPFNFIGFRYSQQHFYSEYYDSHDAFSQVDLWSRLRLKKNWQLMTYVPYKLNQRSLYDFKTRGIGDVSAILNWTAINTYSKEKAKQRHLLMIGGGLKLPTGRYDEDRISEDNLPIPANFQLGSGTTDFISTIFYSLQLNKVSVFVNGTYRKNTTNKMAYCYGDQLNLSAYGAYPKSWKKWTLMPYLGGSFEQSRADVYDGQLQETGGTMGNLLLGVDSNYKKMVFGFSYQLPVTQQLSNNYYEAKGRVNALIAYLF